MKIAFFEMWRDSETFQFYKLRQVFGEITWSIDDALLSRHVSFAKQNQNLKALTAMNFLLQNAMHSIPSILTSFIVILSYS